MARLMTRGYVDALLLHKEYELDLGGLWSITGFNQVPFTVRKHSKGKTTYSPRKRFALAVRSITAFSNKPLILIAAIGTGILVSRFPLFCLYSLGVFSGGPSARWLHYPGAFGVVPGGVDDVLVGRGGDIHLNHLYRNQETTLYNCSANLSGRGPWIPLVSIKRNWKM